MVRENLISILEVMTDARGPCKCHEAQRTWLAGLSKVTAGIPNRAMVAATLSTKGPYSSPWLAQFLVILDFDGIVVVRTLLLWNIAADQDPTYFCIWQQALTVGP